MNFDVQSHQKSDDSNQFRSKEIEKNSLHWVLNGTNSKKREGFDLNKIVSPILGHDSIIVPDLRKILRLLERKHLKYFVAISHNFNNTNLK